MIMKTKTNNTMITMITVLRRLAMVELCLCPKQAWFLL